jgi:BMFP domain-containing protein YqiC
LQEENDNIGEAYQMTCNKLDKSREEVSLLRSILARAREVLDV